MKWLLTSKNLIENNFNTIISQYSYPTTHFFIVKKRDMELFIENFKVLQNIT